MVDGGIQGGSVLPEINIEGGTRVTESVSRQLETEVVKQTVLLYVDPKMPKERRELLVRLSSDLADIDPARGDEIAVEDRPAGSASSPPVVAATVEAAPRFGLALLAGCVTLLFCAGIIAFGFSKRGAQFGATITGGGSGGERAEGEMHLRPGEAAATATIQAARARRREETGAFQVLADVTIASAVYGSTSETTWTSSRAVTSASTWNAPVSSRTRALAAWIVAVAAASPGRRCISPSARSPPDPPPVMVAPNCAPRFEKPNAMIPAQKRSVTQPARSARPNRGAASTVAATTGGDDAEPAGRSSTAISSPRAGSMSARSDESRTSSSRRSFGILGST